MSLVPIWPRFVRPALELLAESDTLKRGAIIAGVADRAGLSEQARAELVESGEPRYRGRIGWALTHSAKAGLVERPSRGVYRLTGQGRAWLAEHPAGLQSFAEANQFFAPFWPNPALSAAVDEPQTPAAGAVEEAAAADPIVDHEELAQDAVTGMNESVRADLLRRLQDATPEFFEDAVVKLLVAMGYGGSQGRAQVTGESHDGGIDGVIDGDALGLDQVYVQAKRYAEGNTVGREAIQAFVGALHGHGATKGVFLTTSVFSKPALDYTAAIPTRIALVDGRKLTQLMLKHRVGVQVRKVLEILEVDEDFFE